jgi:hypothetical protein
VQIGVGLGVLGLGEAQGFGGQLGGAEAARESRPSLTRPMVREGMAISMG